MHKNVESLDAQVDYHLTTKSKGLRWGTRCLILFLLLRKDQLSLSTGEGGEGL